MRKLLLTILFCLAAWHADAGSLLLLSAGGGGGSTFTPASLTNLALWYDPSDSTTVFTDTGCTTPAVAGNVVQCIKDKSSNHWDATGSTGPTLRNSGAIWWLEFTGTQSLASAGAANIYNNVPYGLIEIAGQAVTGADGPALLAAGAANATRINCGYGTGSVGWQLRARRLDADTPQAVTVGAASLGVDTVVRCDARWTAATANLFINNVASTSTGSFLTAGNTQATGGTDALVGVDFFSDFFVGRIYGIIARVPTAAPTSTTMNNTDTWLCSKAGISC